MYTKAILDSHTEKVTLTLEIKTIESTSMFEGQSGNWDKKKEKDKQKKRAIYMHTYSFIRKKLGLFSAAACPFPPLLIQLHIVGRE